MCERRMLAVIVILASSAASLAQDAPKAAEDEKKVVELGEVSVDRAAGTVSLPVKVVRNEYALEYLLVKAGGKEYESLLSTKADPRHIHAGLLLLGLAPGLPAEWAGDKYVPPRGAKVALTLEWTDSGGRKRSVHPMEWLKPVGDAAKVSAGKNEWVFVGSDILPDGSYAAVVDTGIISVTNLPSAVLDVPFASSRAMDERRFDSDRTKMPAAGTDMTLIITPAKDADKAPYARALLEIDRLGRMRIDGAPIARNDLRAWANKFVRKHTEGMVVIRIFPATPGGYAAMAMMELKVGGVFHFDREIVPPSAVLPPRTKADLEERLVEWDKLLAHPEEEIVPPAEQLKDELDRLALEQRILEKQMELLRTYAEQLRQRQASGATPPQTAPSTHNGAKPASEAQP